MRALSIAATGMLAQQLNVEVISNNIANMNTTAFKRQRAEFQDLLYQNLERMGSASSDQGTVVPTGIQVGSGVKTGSVYRIVAQGDLMPTESPYDLAIEGKGFFRVRMPTGENAYTRAGSFGLSATGEIVTNDGYVVEPGISIPEGAVATTINAQGQVYVRLAGQTTDTLVGQFGHLCRSDEADRAAMECMVAHPVAPGAGDGRQVRLCGTCAWPCIARAGTSHSSHPREC